MLKGNLICQKCGGKYDESIPNCPKCNFPLFKSDENSKLNNNNLKKNFNDPQWLVNPSLKSYFGICGIFFFLGILGEILPVLILNFDSLSIFPWISGSIVCFLLYKIFISGNLRKAIFHSIFVLFSIIFLFYFGSYVGSYSFLSWDKTLIFCNDFLNKSFLLLTNIILGSIILWIGLIYLILRRIEPLPGKKLIEFTIPLGTKTIKKFSTGESLTEESKNFLIDSLNGLKDSFAKGYNTCYNLFKIKSSSLSVGPKLVALTILYNSLSKKCQNMVKIIDDSLKNYDDKTSRAVSSPDYNLNLKVLFNIIKEIINGFNSCQKITNEMDNMKEIKNLNIEIKDSFEKISNLFDGISKAYSEKEKILWFDPEKLTGNIEFQYFIFNPNPLEIIIKPKKERYFLANFYLFVVSNARGEVLRGYSYNKERFNGESVWVVELYFVGDLKWNRILLMSLLSPFLPAIILLFVPIFSLFSYLYEWKKKIVKFDNEILRSLTSMGKTETEEKPKNALEIAREKSLWDWICQKIKNFFVFSPSQDIIDFANKIKENILFME